MRLLFFLDHVSRFKRLTSDTSSGTDLDAVDCDPSDHTVS